jgi:hypothetical protein
VTWIKRSSASYTYVTRPNGSGSVTVNAAPLLASPWTLTTTGPDEAPGGTVAVMRSEAQDVGAAATPLNVTRFDPWLDVWLAPKFVPKMETGVPTGPLVGARALIAGGGTGDGTVSCES